jgi:hypothetical protein
MTSVLVAALDRFPRTGDPMIYRVITCRYRDEMTPDQVDELHRRRMTSTPGWVTTSP